MINISLSLVLYLYIGYVMLIYMYRNIDVKNFDRKCRFLVIC